MNTAAKDAEHLRLLSIFHYVVAGLAAMFSCLPIFHLLIGVAMVNGWGEFGEPGGLEPVAGIMGCFLIVFAGGFILAGWTFAASLALAGRYLSQRRRYTFCLVMAGIACAFGPFGTVLGVFTIITLVRESVKEQFDRGDAPVVVPAE